MGPQGETQLLSDGTDGGAADDPESALSLSDSDVFDILGNSRRRAVLAYLLREENASLRELTEVVAAEEYDVAADDITAEQRKRVYTGLYQCHLPRLDDFDVVEFDRDDKEVVIRDAAAEVEPYLDRGERTAAVRAEFALAVTVATVVTPGVFGVGPLDGVPVRWWAILTVVALFGVALLQLHGRGALPTGGRGGV